VHSSERDTYHHGNLRQALLDAAMEVVRDRGVEGLTLREVARRAGVSHAAPYHHFRDKGALVAALAVDGFERFRVALTEARDQTVGSHGDRIRAEGVAYVRFAFEEPDRFKLMWRPELRDPADSEVDEVGLRSYEVLIEEINRGQRAGEVREGDTGELSLAAWATVHGLSMIIVDGPLRGQVTTWAMVEPLLEPVLDTVMRGIAR
jgi:AcrR family transcriptional regulator